MSVQSSDQMNTYNSKKIARWGWKHFGAILNIIVKV